MKKRVKKILKAPIKLLERYAENYLKFAFKAKNSIEFGMFPSDRKQFRNKKEN